MNPLQKKVQHYLNGYIEGIKEYQYLPLLPNPLRKDLLDLFQEGIHLPILQDLVVLMLYYGTRIRAFSLCQIRWNDLSYNTERKMVRLYVAEETERKEVLVDEETSRFICLYQKHAQTNLFCYMFQKEGNPMEEEALFALLQEYPN